MVWEDGGGDPASYPVGEEVEGKFLLGPGWSAGSVGPSGAGGGGGRRVAPRQRAKGDFCRGVGGVRFLPNPPPPAQRGQL